MSRILRRCPKCNRWFVSSDGRPGRPRVECIECNPKSGGELEGDPRVDGFMIRNCRVCGKRFKTCNDFRHVCTECATRAAAADYAKAKAAFLETLEHWRKYRQAYGKKRRAKNRAAKSGKGGAVRPSTHQPPQKG